MAQETGVVRELVPWIAGGTALILIQSLLAPLELPFQIATAIAVMVIVLILGHRMERGSSKGSLRLKRSISRRKTPELEVVDEHWEVEIPPGFAREIDETVLQVVRDPLAKLLEQKLTDALKPRRWRRFR